MNIPAVLLSSLVSMIALFTLTKLMGNREMSQLSLYDYVSSVAIGSIAGELAIISTGSIIEPLVSMIFFAVVTIILSFITCKSIWLRRIFQGYPLLLFQDGQIYEKNLLKAKLDIGEFLSVCRISGYYDLEDIYTVYLETNGQISVLPRIDNQEQLQSQQQNQKQEQKQNNSSNQVKKQPQPMANVIIDGKLMPINIKYVGKTEKWVKEQVKKQKIENINDIILATYDTPQDKLHVYLKYHKKMLKDIFQ